MSFTTLLPRSDLNQSQNIIQNTLKPYINLGVTIQTGVPTPNVSLANNEYDLLEIQSISDMKITVIVPDHLKPFVEEIIQNVK